MARSTLKAVPSPEGRDRIITLRIDIVGAKPKIWRRVEVPSDFTLGDLHHVIQYAMGWENSHLHAFMVGRNTYSERLGDDEYEPIGEDGDSVTLESLGLYRKGRTFAYEYDFGDSWTHEILVESAADRKPKTIYPRCTKAVGACPLEDSGGIYQYQRLLRILKTPTHREYEDVSEWLDPEFDPKRVDIEEINKYLANGFAI
jgi:hypothetical protein